jgi:hypothetical protein
VFELALVVSEALGTALESPWPAINQGRDPEAVSEFRSLTARSRVRCRKETLRTFYPANSQGARPFGRADDIKWIVNCEG